MTRKVKRSNTGSPPPSRHQTWFPSSKALSFLPELQAELDADGRIIWLSPSLERLLDRGPAEAACSPWQVAVPRSRFPALAAAIESLLGGAELTPVFPTRGADGELRYFEGAGRRLGGGYGELAGHVLWFRDVSDRVAIEEAFAKAKAENEALLREVLHRTRNNMQVICAILEAIKEDFPGEDAAAALDSVADRINAMSLIHAKLNGPADFEKVDLGTCIPELVGRIAEEHDGQSRVDLVLDLQPVEVEIDTAIPCGLILNELITNSYSHAFPGRRPGQVRVGLKNLLDGAIQMEVEDDGIGFPAGFDPRRPTKSGLRTVIGLGESQLYGQVRFGSGKGVRCSVVFKEVRQERLF